MHYLVKYLINILICDFVHDLIYDFIHDLIYDFIEIIDFTVPQIFGCYLSSLAVDWQWTGMLFPNSGGN